MSGAVGIGAVKGVRVAQRAKNSNSVNQVQSRRESTVPGNAPRGGVRPPEPNDSPQGGASAVSIVAEQPPPPLPSADRPRGHAPAATPSAQTSTISGDAGDTTRPAVGPADTVVESNSLSDEAASADRVRQFADALAVLNKHRQRFPSGLLAQEMLVLRIETLFGLGDRAALLPRAHAFVVSNPASPHARRVRTILDAVER